MLLQKSIDVEATLRSALLLSRGMCLMPERASRIKPLRTRRSLWLILCAFLHSLTFTVSAAPPRHPRIPSYERFYAVKNTDLRQAGNLLLGELNCLRCHSARPNQERTILTK